jgi:hypothetical protein
MTIYISVAGVVAVLCGVGLALRSRLGWAGCCANSRILVNLRGADGARAYDTADGSSDGEGDDVWKDLGFHEDEDENNDGVAAAVSREPSIVASV